MPELITEPTKVPLPVPVVIPAKTITDTKVNFVTYTYQTLDAVEGVVTLEQVIVPSAELATKTKLLAELNKDAAIHAATLGG